jgi:hypothetical protein
MSPTQLVHPYSYPRRRIGGRHASRSLSTDSATIPQRTARQYPPFEKGVSGNPGGRPRELADVKALAREHTTEAIETLVGLMRSGKTDSARAAAASELLSRAWGKPSLPLLHESGPAQLILTDEQHASLMDALRVATVQQSVDPTMSG